MAEFHLHHILYRCQGGSDDPPNLVEMNFVEHARLHAIDFINGGPWFDCRHDGWHFLEDELVQAVKEEMSRRLSERMSGEGNPNYGKNLPENTRRKISEALSGEKHHFYGKSHSEITRRKISDSGTGRRFSEDSRRKMSESRTGEKHYSFGKATEEHHCYRTIWITNGVASRRIPEEQEIPTGWRRGRPK